jgi:hypothetical protein
MITGLPDSSRSLSHGYFIESNLAFSGLASIHSSIELASKQEINSFRSLIWNSVMGIKPLMSSIIEDGYEPLSLQTFNDLFLLS